MSTQNQGQEKLRDYIRAARMDSILGGVGATLRRFRTLYAPLLYAEDRFKSQWNKDATRRSLVTHETGEDLAKLGHAECIVLAQRIENKGRRNVACQKNTEVVYFAEQLGKRMLGNSSGTLPAIPSCDLPWPIARPFWFCCNQYRPSIATTVCCENAGR